LLVWNLADRICETRVSGDGFSESTDFVTWRIRQVTNNLVLAYYSPPSRHRHHAWIRYPVHGL